MADRYWVGGSGSWNSTTKWSTTSGGASGASVPTAADNAIFDANSSAAHYLVTVTDNATCANLTFTPEPVAGVTQFAVGVNFVIAGTFSTSGTQGNRRVWFRSSTFGLMRDMQIATIGTVTDVDFRDIRVTGTGGTLTGTRIGDLRGCVNITFDTPKTVYWNLAGAQNWSANGWSDTSTGTPSTDFFPLAQDTATFTNAGSVTGTITMNSAVINYTGTVDMSGRTSAMTLSVGSFTIYGNWTNGSGTTLAGTGTLIYSGRNTQTITSAGKTFTGSIFVDSYGGSVELADALNIGSTTLTVTNGTFDTKNYNVAAGGFEGFGTGFRNLKLGSSTITISGNSPFGFYSQSAQVTVDAGTSTIICTATSASVYGGGLSLYNLSFTSTSAGQYNFLGAGGNLTVTNLTVTAPSSAGLRQLSLAADQTITGTLTVAGASPVRRLFVRSSTLGTQRTLNVGTLSADDCDFIDIAITGTAAGSSPTRAGDCGGNSGITFPAGKTVYWNLAGAQSWSATAWAPSSGGTPDINNFPLAQDTAVFDDTGSVTGTITINAAWNIGTFDASLRTSAMTLSNGAACFVYGDWTFGTGVTSSSTTNIITFAKRGTQTITSNGITFNHPITIDCFSGTVQLADALVLNAARTLRLTSGTFDAVTYNVTTGLFEVTVTTNTTLKMGSGTWTLSGTGNFWMASNAPSAFYKGTANIVLSNTSTSARSFAGRNLSYNKLTIGGTTGTSTLTITGNNQFTELASTKTVAHTIALGTTTQTFGKWTVTGTAGNVVTLTGTGVNHILAGACTDSIDYLAMGSIGFAATSPGEFYAGANSTGIRAAPVYRTAKPADSTRYWVGGTGNWSDTARWSTSSGGASGASVPRSHDDVVFDSASNATAYTATVNAVTGGIRMKALTIAGPASGNVTLAGSTAINGIHGNVTLPATGLTRTYTGAITLSSNSTGLTFTTNGVTLSNAITVNGVDCEWSLGSALTHGSQFINLINGVFDSANYSITGAGIAVSENSTTLTLGSSSCTFNNSNPFYHFVGGTAKSLNFTFNAGTSSITFSGLTTQNWNSPITFYNVTLTNNSPVTVTFSNANETYNNLTISKPTNPAMQIFVLRGNTTVNSTLTFSTGTDATRRHFVRSDTIGTTRTITAAAVSMTDVDFRDITIAGAAAPASGTRIGDCKGNSGITFDAAANKYWNLAAGGSWGGAIAWATSSGGTPNINNFPLAQDTCFFEATGLNSGATVTVNQSYNIGTIDMSARTTNTMTLATGSTTPAIYGNWINGTGTTITGTNNITFAGRSSQTITSAGKTFGQAFTIDSPSGSLALNDAMSCVALTLTSGTLDAVSYNVTSTNNISAANSNVRTIAIGSGTWTMQGSSTAWSASISTNLTVTGTGTISLTSASAKTFAGGSVDYSGITLNQGGNGTLNITGNNTFKTISSTATGATTINPGNWVQRITTSWTASGSAGNILTITGASATNPGTFIFTGSGQAADVDYLIITGIRAYNLDSTWYAGANSTNNGSLGWLFEAPGGTVFDVDFSDTATGADSVAVAASTFNAAFADTATGLDALTTIATLNVAFADTATGADSVTGGLLIFVAFADTASGSDALTTTATLAVAISDTATGSDALTTTATLAVAISDTASGADALSVSAAFNVSLSETASGADAISASATLNVAFADTATGADALSVSATFNVSLSETATGLDEVSPAGSTFNVSLSDAGTITDLVAGNYLWNPIDDTQSANWQNVVTAQTPAWTEITNTQGPNWVEIQT